MDEVTTMMQYSRVPNALLFTGNEGSGRREAALLLAKSLDCLDREASIDGSPCNRCRSCLKIDAEMHPDIINIYPEKQIIKIDRIRELSGSISAKPHEARMRMVMIHQAHTMNQEAANSLLKSLEEPPDRTFFLLTAPDLTELLPTIISRCRHIHFKPVSSSHISLKLVQKYSADPDQALIAARSSSGNMKRAMMLLNLRDDIQVDWIRRRHWLLSWIFNILKPGTPPTNALGHAMMMAEKLSKEEEELLGDSLLLIKLWFRDMAIVKVLNDFTDAEQTSMESSSGNIEYERVECYSKGEIIHEHTEKFMVNTDFQECINYLVHVLPGHFPLKSLDAVHTAEKRLRSNASVRLILENFFLSLLLIRRRSVP
ncbi:MAG: DNA polymerase III subunit delta' [Desulfamplus sp.]|nr:DNA polymerase III subunit delta' [Desulfamplus sp.]